MAIKKPYCRTIRQLADGSYSDSGNGLYILHKQYAKEPQHYTRVYELIQTDLLKLFEYVEPTNSNLQTASLKINELLVRTCIEIEANFTAILKENGYARQGNWCMKNDYYKIAYSHNLENYKVRFPVWRGQKNIRQPFLKWEDKTKDNWFSLEWYQIYNKAKHERYEYFEKATFDVLLDSVAALVVILTSQFMDENFTAVSKGMGIGEYFSYDYDPLYVTAIGNYFTIKYPDNWKDDEKYDFDWQYLDKEENPIQFFNYNKINSTF